ncbi:hypothetical protein L2E82_31341 [Cichorium intybus]|uniref:Uncharacterized protein n=1 Tax=Cichorium intybus TaxID=13427 RepID=A0ACB9D2S3_CICIN|nr:hypothetical protein L2E82_31341 [Cichorium intybus]
MLLKTLQDMSGRPPLIVYEHNTSPKARKDCTALGLGSEGNELGCFSSKLPFLCAHFWALHLSELRPDPARIIHTPDEWPIPIAREDPDLDEVASHIGMKGNALAAIKLKHTLEKKGLRLRMVPATFLLTAQLRAVTLYAP